ncbi:hypothetical protein BpHYR1_034997 [Brachionus plicatilis]|uniref:Uncharacterized protein n=1 Tax=Brachionus plicatilis TaxID=10195 RepID=A0A3M7R8I1_BRAPC|nr:hypothetical protein BpHYR1_034997 [Brachionus plicatilis]
MQEKSKIWKPGSIDCRIEAHRKRKIFTFLSKTSQILRIVCVCLWKAKNEYHAMSYLSFGALHKRNFLIFINKQKRERERETPTGRDEFNFWKFCAQNFILARKDLESRSRKI